jgi:hypothetical protein
MTMDRNWFFVLSCTLLAMASTAGCGQSTPDSVTTPCEVRQHPEQFDGKAILVRADIQGDWERTVLSAPSCPTLGIAVTFSESALKKGDAEKLNAAARDQLFGKPANSISVTVEGTFIAPKATGDSATLVVDRVVELSIREPSRAE